MAEKLAVIVARGLRKSFGEVTAVDGIDLEVREGECFGILGPNGAGKTSTMRMLYDFSPRDGGELSVFGLDPARQGVQVRQMLGVVQQKDNLDQELTVRENLEVYAGYYGIDFSSRGELIACTSSVEEICEFIGADSLGYLSLEGMFKAMPYPSKEFCSACFTGKYPVKIADEFTKTCLEGGTG